MRDGKIVVLQVLGGLNVGGAESRIMDILRHIDKEVVQYDFLLHSQGPDAYEDEAKKLGANIYRVPRFKLYNMASYKKAMKDFFVAHPEIDIVQGHITSSAAIYLPIAKSCGIGVTIAHTRSAGVDRDLRGILTLMLTKNLYKKCDYMWACSSDAAIALYGQNNYDNGMCKVIPNAIDTNRFIIANENNVKNIEDEYNLTDKFVVGHVGRFDDVKNHPFLLEVFKEILKRKDNAVLLLVGSGETMDAIKEMASRLNLSDNVIFAGNHKNVEDYYHNMDLIVFPSKYEGLPGTIVEAQCCILPCLLSDTITRDVAVTELIDYESLKASPEVWADKALALYERTRNLSKDEVVATMREKGFDVTAQVEMLKNSYRQLVGNNEG